MDARWPCREGMRPLSAAVKGMGMGRRRTLGWLAGAAAVAGAIGGAGLSIALQQQRTAPAAVAAAHRPNQPATIWEHRITPVADPTVAAATEIPGSVTTSVEAATPTATPTPTTTPGPSTSPAPSPTQPAATATATTTTTVTQAPPTATATPPASATPAPVGTAAPPEDTPPPPEPGEVLPGELAALLGEVRTGGWIAASFAGFPLSALIPPSYYARLTRASVIDGDGEIATLRVSSYDLDAYSGTAGGKAWLTVDLYPASGPGEKVTIIQPRGTIAGSLRLVPAAFPELTLSYWEAMSVRPPAITVSYQGHLPDGRYVIVSGGASRPLAPRLVIDFIGVIESLRVTGP